jgi:hypothetical protein
MSNQDLVVNGVVMEKVVLTAESKGAIAWDYDELAFPPTRVETCGPKLILFPIAPGQYRIRLIMWDEKRLQKIVLVVTGSGPIPPIPPGPSAPTLNQLTPNAAQMGSPNFPLSVGGTGFLNPSTVLFNNTPIQTSYNGPMNLQAVIPAAQLAAPGIVNVAVQNANGTSNTLQFTISQMPIPPPLPKAECLTLVTIWESADATPAVAKVMKDAVYWQSLVAACHKYAQIDKDSKELDATGKETGKTIVDARGYAPYIAKYGLPTLLVFDQKTGQLLTAMKLPATTAEITAIIKGITGK